MTLNKEQPPAAENCAGPNCQHDKVGKVLELSESTAYSLLSVHEVSFNRSCSSHLPGTEPHGVVIL